MPGLCLMSPHGELIAKGKKTLFVKSEAHMKYAGEEIYFIEDDKIGRAHV